MIKKLNILQVNTRDLVGGAEKSAYFLFNKFRELGHNSWLAVGEKSSNDPDIFEIPQPKPKNTLINTFITNLARENRKLVSLSPSKKGVTYYLNALATRPFVIQRTLERKCGREDFIHPGTWQLLKLPPGKPNIVHLHNLHGGYFDLRYLPKLSRQVPVILNLRDMWTLTGHCAYPVNCSRWKFGCGHCPDLNIYPAIMRDATRFNYQKKKNIYSQCKLYITTPTKWLMDQVLISKMFSAIEYKIIPNAINLQLFQPGNKYLAREALGLSQDAQIVLFLAHSEFKDLETMRSAISYLRKGQSPLIFICIGLTSVNEIIGEGELIYTGRIFNDKTMALYYQAADVYLHAAHHEVFGRSIAEAMACATPVVATGIDGIPEVVQNGKTGFLTPAKNPFALAEKINALLQNPSLRVEIGVNSSNYARKSFDLTIQTENFLDWYNKIITKDASR